MNCFFVTFALCALSPGVLGLIGSGGEATLFDLICNQTLELFSDFHLDLGDTKDQPDGCLDRYGHVTLGAKVATVNEYIQRVQSSYRDYVEHSSPLWSRVSRSKAHQQIGASQTIGTLEVTSAKVMVKAALTDKVNNSMVLIAKTSGDQEEWIPLENLSSLKYETEELAGTCKRYYELARRQVVTVSSNDTINGTCCISANITAGAETRIELEDVFIVKDSENVWLDGEVTWGFIKTNEADRDISGTINFVSDVEVTALETPSIDLTRAILNDSDSMVIHSRVNFTSLEVANMTLHNGGSGQKPKHDLSSIVKIFDPMPADLSYFGFDQVNLTTLTDSTISGINLMNLVTYRGVQSSNATLTIDKMFLEGPSLSGEQSFVPQLVDQMVAFVNATSAVHYNQLTLDSINVTRIQTDSWDEHMFHITNDSVDMDDILINGALNFQAKVNQMDLENDLIILDATQNETEPIDALLAFEEPLTMAYETISVQDQELNVDDWTIEGGLELRELNGREWKKIIEDLLPLNELGSDLAFDAPIEASRCHFTRINDQPFSNMVNYREIKGPIKFGKLQINKLELDGWDVASCVKEEVNFAKTDDEPLNELHVVNLEVVGQVNGIEVDRFIVNNTNQDFRPFDGSLISSSLDFKGITLLHGPEGAANCDVYQLNGLDLNRLLRGDPSLKWPEIMTLSTSNLTYLNISHLHDHLFSHYLLNEVDQRIDSEIAFARNVTFESNVIFEDPLSSIGLPLKPPLDEIRLSSLKIDGNLTINGLTQQLDTETETYLAMGAGITGQLKVHHTISISNETDGIIYRDSNWTVLRKSTISEHPDLNVKEMNIEGDLKIFDDQVKPWLHPDSLDGIEYYTDVTLDNLTAEFEANVNYNQLVADEAEIRLEEVLDPLESNSPTTLRFEDRVIINGDVNGFETVEMNQNMLDDGGQKIRLSVQTFNESTTLMFNEAVLLIGDLRYTQITDSDIIGKKAGNQSYEKVVLKGSLLSVGQVNDFNWTQMVTSETGEFEFEKLNRMDIVALDNVTVNNLLYCNHDDDTNNKGDQCSLEEINYKIDLKPLLRSREINRIEAISRRLNHWEAEFNSTIKLMCG